MFSKLLLTPPFGSVQICSISSFYHVKSPAMSPSNNPCHPLRWADHKASQLYDAFGVAAFSPMGRSPLFLLTISSLLGGKENAKRKCGDRFGNQNSVVRVKVDRLHKPPKLQEIHR
jgi:hypothetical protein